VFWEKRPQAIENKGREFEKERKETQRGGKCVKTMDLPRRHGEHRVRRENWRFVPPHPGAMGIVVKIKGLREKQFVRI
jgi:hypothetical protein